MSGQVSYHYPVPRTHPVWASSFTMHLSITSSEFLGSDKLFQNLRLPSS